MRSTPPAMPPLLRDSRVLLYLFVGFRLMMLLVYQPIKDYTPGLAAFGDLPYFYGLATQADQGKLPYRDYWFEYPPVSALVSQGVYSLTSLRGGDYTAYVVLMNVLLTAFDVGNLILVRRIGTRIHGAATGTALAWVYALLAVPLVITYWNFDTIDAFAILLGITWLLEHRDNHAALATAFGALTKLIPFIMVAVVWRFRPVRSALRYTAIAVGLTIAGMAFILLVGGRFGVASILSQFNKASSETVWALIDGNYRTGILNPDHSDPATATQMLGNSAAIPIWLRSTVFGLIGLYVYATTLRGDDKGLIAFLALTITVFLLWSPNWSPQWQVFLLPLILVNFPSRGGVLLCLLLSLVNFVEFPVLFSHTSGAIPPEVEPVFALLILMRTAMLAGFGVALYQRLRMPGIEIANTGDNE